MSHIISWVPAPLLFVTWYEQPLTWLTVIACLLILGGALMLLLAIPLCSHWAAKRKIRIETEFYSSRAAQRCITAGLVMLVLITVAVVITYVVSRLPHPPQSNVTVNNNVSR